jgi:hypothetical protein
VACLLNQGVQRLVQCFLLFVLVLSHRRFVLGGAPSHKLSDRLDSTGASARLTSDF